jgi:hypothetical protein
MESVMKINYAVGVILAALANAYSATVYTGPVTVTEIKVEAEYIYVKFSSQIANPFNCTDLSWSVITSNPDSNRFLTMLLTAKTTGTGVEVGVMNDDCHTNKIRIASLWLK